MGRLSEIETFVLVARNGSFSAAARELQISPAAVSKQIAKLESTTEIQLLNRSTRKVELTEIGRVYLEQCQRIMEEIDASAALVSQMKATPMGVLHLFSPKHFAEKVIIPNLSEFIELYPKIEIRLTLGERMPHLESEKVDIFIGASASAQENMIQKRIGTTSYTICASAQYLKKFGTPNVLGELSQHRCIAHSGRQPCDYFYGKRGKDIKFHPYMRVNDAESLARLAVLGMGIVQLHHYVVEELIKDGKLVSILEQYTKTNVPIYYALPSRRFTPRKVQVFIDFILNKLNG